MRYLPKTKWTLKYLYFGNSPILGTFFVKMADSIYFPALGQPQGAKGLKPPPPGRGKKMKRKKYLLNFISQGN